MKYLSRLLLAILICLPFSGSGHSQTLGLSPAGTNKPFVALAADFDGTNDWLRRNAGLTGATNDDQGILSIWFRVDGGDGASRTFLSSQGFQKQFHLLATGFYNMRLLSTTAQVILFEENSNAIPSAGANWHHILIAWDMSVPTCQVYIDDVAGAIDDTCIDTVNLVSNTDSDWFIGANSSSGNLKFDGCMSEFYFNHQDTLDLSVEANRRKFNNGSGGSAGGKPVDLGSDGSTPTGNAAIIYMNGNGASAGTNAGTGGNFSINGATADCSTSPSN